MTPCKILTILEELECLIIYNASAIDTMKSLSEKWSISTNDLHTANSSNAAYQSLFNQQNNSRIDFTAPLSDSARRVNTIYCWTRSVNEFLDFDSILIGLNIRKEFIGSGFHNGEVVRKLSDNTLKVRYEDNNNNN